MLPPEDPRVLQEFETLYGHIKPVEVWEHELQKELALCNIEINIVEREQSGVPVEQQFDYVFTTLDVFRKFVMLMNSMLPVPDGPQACSWLEKAFVMTPDGLGGICAVKKPSVDDTLLLNEFVLLEYSNSDLFLFDYTDDSIQLRLQVKKSTDLVPGDPRYDTIKKLIGGYIEKLKV